MTARNLTTIEGPFCSFAVERPLKRDLVSLLERDPEARLRGGREAGWFGDHGDQAEVVEWVASRSRLPFSTRNDRAVVEAIEASHRPLDPLVKVVPEGVGALPPFLRKALERLEEDLPVSDRALTQLAQLGHPRALAIQADLAVE